VPTIQEKVQQFSLSPQELADFHERGYLGPITLYDPQEMKARWKQLRLELLDRSNAIYQDDAAVSGNTNISNYDRHLDNDFLADHVCRPEIVDRVASILGPDVLCWRTEFFPKHPGDEGTDWHQADTFANASGTPQILWPDTVRDHNGIFGGTITVWTAFTEADTETACLQFIPGTHKSMFYDESKGMTYNPDTINTRQKDGEKRGFFGYDYRQLQKDPNWKPDVARAVDMVCRPGQFILFWSTLCHASRPHLGKSDEMRMGFASRYVPNCVRIYPVSDSVQEYGGKINVDKYGAVQVAGENKFTHNRMATHTTRGKAFPNRTEALRAL
jgi:non-heme Fe2+,alpha-ketoglutarate-dependent halogenase